MLVCECVCVRQCLLENRKARWLEIHNRFIFMSLLHDSMFGPTSSKMFHFFLFAHFDNIVF